MPRVRLVLFRDDDGAVPLRDWLDGLPTKAMAKCLVRLMRLEELGHELRRPEGDYLRDGIYELRAQHLRVNYRMLYFYREPDIVVVSHGFTKQQNRVPAHEIDLARSRCVQFDKHRAKHSFEPGDDS